MNESEPFEQASVPWFSSRGLGIVALVLFTLYLTIVLDALVPPRLLDAAWQIRVVGALLNAAGFPLVGLALLHLAADLHPNDPRLEDRRRLCARLAVPVALGFLLLIPLQGHAAWRQRASALASRDTRFEQANARLQRLRTAVDRSASTEDLRRELAALQAPGISAADLEKPLPELKAQLNTLITQTQARIRTQSSDAGSEGILPLVQQLLRNTIASLALAIGFAALGRRHGVEVSALEEGRFLAGRLTSRSSDGQRRRMPDSHYVDLISGEELPPQGREPPDRP